MIEDNIEYKSIIMCCDEVNKTAFRILQKIFAENKQIDYVIYNMN